MFAFGDSVLFMAVFGLAAVPATGAALYFLSPAPPAFWTTLSVASLAVASTSLAALLTYIAPTAFSSLHSWSALAPVRILVAPVFAIFFLLSGLFAPNRSARIALIAATTIELGVLACAAIGWSTRFIASQVHFSAPGHRYGISLCVG